MPTTATNAVVTPAIDDGRHGATRIDGSVDLKDLRQASNGRIPSITSRWKAAMRPPASWRPRT